MSHRLLSPSALLVCLALAIAPAAAQDGQSSSGPRATISPSEGATQTMVQLDAEGLPALSEVVVLGGSDPERLTQIGRGESDPQGGFNIQIQVPEEAERGQPYYFAVGPAGDAGPVLADPPFQVIVRETAPPGGA